MTVRSAAHRPNVLIVQSYLGRVKLDSHTCSTAATFEPLVDLLKDFRQLGN